MVSVNFDRAASYYDATRGFPPGVAEQVRDAIVARVGLARDGRILELGVGTGRIALPFVQAGYRFTGVDLAREMLAVFRGKLEGHHTPPSLVQGDVTDLPFASGSFDLVVGVHVLHLVADWRKTLLEARRVLRPGGTLLMAGSPGRAGPGLEGDTLPPPAQARQHWGDTLAELGAISMAPQPGARLEDPRVQAYLAELGASVQQVTLLEYTNVPLSAREVLQQHRDRIFSMDWALPDELHAAAVERLERWIAERCDDPDTAYGIPGRFRVMLIRWDGPAR
jgi:ubiquinone/menaquinone biosynthesis C-methylase UbiE